ncbi:MAG: DNA cytosine methyltransferase [Acidobacteriota bacterium]
MSVTGLFSGIGGFELAFSLAGFEAGLLVELDPPGNAVLRTQFPGVEVRSDVLDLIDIPADTTILTAGFPCQNLSMAGDKSGITGSKSGIVTRMFELIERSLVPTIVIENVYFMLQLDSGRAMRSLVDEFERLEYRWAYRVLDSMSFGLPQRRRRVYFIASRDIDPRTVLFADDVTNILVQSKPDMTKPLGFYWTEGRSGLGLTTDGIPPLKVGSSLGIPSAPAVLFLDGEVLMPSLLGCERLQGFPADWTHAANPTGGTKDPRWRLLGNAVSVPVAQWVAERIKNPGIVLELEQVPSAEWQRWPDAAWNVGEGRVGVTATDRPAVVDSLSISELRDGSWTRLSNRALNGFIARASGGGLWMPEGFLDALRKAARKAPSVIEVPAFA